MAMGKTALVKMLLCVLLIGGAAWTFTSVSGLGTSVLCIVNAIDDLKNVDATTVAGQSSAQAANAVPSDVMDTVKMAVPLLGALSITPAVLIALMGCLIAYCTMKTKAGQSAKCTKCLMLLFTILCCIGIIFYGLIGGVGIAMGSAQGEDAKNQLMQTCRDNIGTIAIPGTLQIELTTAQSNVITATQTLTTQTNAHNANHPSVVSARTTLDDANRELAAAQQGLNILRDMCGCFDDVFNDFSDFTAPGIACALLCVLLFIINCCACCGLCCCKRKSMSTATTVGV